MRTDDFQDDIHPTDPSEPRPDKHLEDDGLAEDFNEFDQPTTQGGNSLGEIWRNNPLIKIAVISIGVITLIAGYMVFGGSGTEAPRSDVGTVVQDNEVPGGPTTEAYRDAINDVNQQRLEQAMRQGTSSIPIPTAGTETTTPEPVVEEPPVTVQDPLADWRAAVQQPVEQQPVQQQPTIQQPYPQQQPQAMGPDPQAVDALAQAMGQQMQSILQKHAIAGPQVMAVTSADYFEQQAQNNNQQPQTPAVEETEVILVPAGTIAYAQTITEANSDVQGPVLARIASGPLTGSRILGTFQLRQKKLVLVFNKVVIKGVTYPVNGIALDPKTTLPAVVTEVDNRYWRRFILPAAARFIEGMGDAIAQREQSVVVSNGTAVSSQSDLNTTEELAAGFAEGTRSISEDIDALGNNIQPLVRVHAGTPIGVLFLDPVIDQE